MKFTKMSLVAALLVGSSAFAIENVKVSGDAKLYYSTTQDTFDMFSKEASAGQAAASVSVSGDLTKGISFGSKATALSTLGLQGQLVNNVWEGTNAVSDSYIVNDLWLAGTVGKTTGKIGRMELDTPLVFTEKWSIVENTFEAAVVINQDIPNTTLVGAYVGGSNGSHNGSANGGHAAGIANVVDTTANETTFTQFWNGAYAVGAINNSVEDLTLQAWYYQATKIATAFWLQADVAKKGFMGGLQVTSTDLTNATSGALSAATAVAVMGGYEMKDVVTVKLAYSMVSDDNADVRADWVGGAGFNLSGTNQSKLYTEAWWNYGYITSADTTSINLTVESPVKGIVDLGLYATMADNGTDDTRDMTEVTVTASKTFGPLDATAAVIYADVNDNQSGTLQAYLTYNF